MPIHRTVLATIAAAGAAMLATAVLANPQCYVQFEDDELTDLSDMCGQETDTADDGSSPLTAEDYYSLSRDAETYEEAIEYLTRAIQLDPINEVYLQQRSAVYTYVGNIRAAVDDFEAIKQNYIDSGGEDPDVIETLDNYILLLSDDL